jgi:enamine deaminase RidA (YjgF/YER057c/UK114 family)
VEDLFPHIRKDFKEKSSIPRRSRRGCFIEIRWDINYKKTDKWMDGGRMKEIKRSDVNEEWAHSGIVEAGDFVFVNYCVGNIGQPVENQIDGAIDHLNSRLESVGLSLESVVKMDCLFRDIWNIPIMEKVIKRRFKGKYPVRKSIQSEFAHTGGQEGLLFQLDAVAYKG